jgi:hypothetical protein
MLKNAIPDRSLAVAALYLLQTRRRVSEPRASKRFSVFFSGLLAISGRSLLQKQFPEFCRECFRTEDIAGMAAGEIDWLPAQNARQR